MKAILLIRVSTQVQDLVQQREIVIKEALKDGYNENDIIIIEDKESASKLSEEERNGINKLKEYIEADKDINCVYTYEISRISRRAAVVYSVRDYLIKHNIQLVIINPYCRLLNADGTISETSNILFGIFATMAENETMIRKARTERGIQKLISEGKHGRCRPLFGYDVNEDKYYIPHNKNAEIVRLIFRLYNRGTSIRKIAIELHERGIFGKITFTDLSQRIYKILKEERYVGNNVYPALIDKETFNIATTLRTNNRIEYKTTNIYICKGILKDKYTGQTLSAKKTLKRYSTLNINRSEDFKQISIGFDIIEPLVLDFAIRLHKKYASTYSQKNIDTIAHDIQVLNNKIHNFNDIVRNQEEARDRIEERLIMGKISDKKADELEEKISATINETNRHIEITKQQIEHLKHLLEHNETNKTIDYDNLNREEQAELIKEVVNVVLISKPNRGRAIVEIYNNYNDDIETHTFITHGRKTREICG